MGIKLPHSMNCWKRTTLFQSIIKTCKFQQQICTKYPILCFLKFLTIFLHQGLPTVSSSVSAPSWNINLTPFYLGFAPQKILNLSDSPFLSNPPQNFGENDSPPPPLEMYQKSKDSFFKEKKDFISDIEIWICSCKI